jgi:hypothetical protein
VNDHRVRRQIVEQRRRALEEERQVELDSRRRDAISHTTIDPRLGRIALESRPEATPEFLDGFRIQRHFTSRQQTHTVE